MECKASFAFMCHIDLGTLVCKYFGEFLGAGRRDGRPLLYELAVMEICNASVGPVQADECLVIGDIRCVLDRFRYSLYGCA